MDPYSEENDEHEAIAAIREQLGDEYWEDVPQLSVEFPLGAFDDSTTDSFFWLPFHPINLCG